MLLPIPGLILSQIIDTNISRHNAQQIPGIGVILAQIGSVVRSMVHISDPTSDLDPITEPRSAAKIESLFIQIIIRHQPLCILYSNRRSYGGSFSSMINRQTIDQVKTISEKIFEIIRLRSVRTHVSSKIQTFFSIHFWSPAPAPGKGCI